MDAPESANQESHLVAQAQEGSKDAFCGLIRMHQAYVQAYLGRSIRSRDIIEDLSQETFVKAYRSLATYKATSSLRVWLLAIARNECLMYLRTEERRRSRETSSLESTLTSWLTERMEKDGSPLSRWDARLKALSHCIQALPEHSAGMLSHFYFKGASTEEIARQTGKKKTTVAVTLLRIRQALRQCIDFKLGAMGTRT